MPEKFSDKELADWLDGFACDMSDMGCGPEYSENLRRAARLIRKNLEHVDRKFPYLVASGRN